MHDPAARTAPATVLEPAPEIVPDSGIGSALGERAFVVVPDFLAASEWQPLAREARALHARGAFRHAGMGRGDSFRIEPESRSDHVCWIDAAQPSRRQARWLARIEQLRQRLNQMLFLGLFGFETHLALYPPGARYTTHLDRFRDASHRTVSLILYLNEGWTAEDGGTLRIYLEAPDREPWQDVLPIGGTLVAFLSHEVHHEVLPARRERLSVVGWLTRRPGESSFSGRDSSSSGRDSSPSGRDSRSSGG